MKKISYYRNLFLIIQILILIFTVTVILFLVPKCEKWIPISFVSYMDASPVKPVSENQENMVSTETVILSSSVKSEESKLNFTKTEESENSSLSMAAIYYSQTCSKKLKTYTSKTLYEAYDETVIRRHPNLPEFLIRSSRLSILIPHITKIRWSGTVYQESWKEHPKCFLYSANFDSRLETGLIVRLLSLCEEKKMKLNYYCQFWFNETESPVVSSVYEAGFPGIYTGGNMPLKPMMMNCKVPQSKSKRKPIAISLVKKPCTKSTNILKIGGSPYKNEMRVTENESSLTIGLCGKALYYYNKDFSVRLIEWIEILKILGISKFFLYKAPCHENVEKVLDYYEKQGIVKVLSFHYPSPYIQEGTFLRLWTKSNLAEFRAGQRMFYNDCILRNKDGYDYLSIFDYDEIPILGKHQNLTELLKHLRKQEKHKKVAGYGLHWKTFYSSLEPGSKAANISDYLHILRHNRRTSLGKRLNDERNSKSIYDTRRILYVDCHRPIKYGAVLPFSDKLMVLPRQVAFTGHFPERNCDWNCLQSKIEEETFLLQYRKEIFIQTEMLLQELKLKPGNMNIKQ